MGRTIPLLGGKGEKKLIFDLEMEKDKCKALEGRPIKKDNGRYACIIPPDDDIEIVDVTSEGVIKARNPETGEEMKGRVEV